MSNKIKVFTVETLLEHLNKNPDDFLVLNVKNKKNENGVVYIDIRFRIDGKLYEPWFKVRGLKLLRGVADPTDTNDKRNRYVTDKNQNIRFSVSVSGRDYLALTDFLKELNIVWLRKIETLKTQYPFMKNKLPKDLLVLEYGANSGPDKAGKPLEDPIIRLKVDFKKYPANYFIPALAGKPKTTVYDASKPKRVGGKTTYEKAVVVGDDGAPADLDENNAHKFITRGSTIVEARINMGSACVSNMGITASLHIVNMVLDRSNDIIFDDEDEEETEGAEGSEGTEGVERTEGAEGTEGAEKTEGAEGAEKTPNEGAVDDLPVNE